MYIYIINIYITPLQTAARGRRSRGADAFEGNSEQRGDS